MKHRLSCKHKQTFKALRNELKAFDKSVHKLLKEIQSVIPKKNWKEADGPDNVDPELKILWGCLQETRMACSEINEKFKEAKQCFVGIRKPKVRNK